MSTVPAPTAHGVLGWSIDDHLSARRRGVSAVAVIDAVLAALDALDDPSVLIGEPLRETARAAAAALDGTDPAGLPLHGVPFLVKDNIDVAGAATTCAYPPYRRLAVNDAAVVARLRAAGAIPVGKTNLDQFATGLVGTRSPYGVPRNPIDATLVPGGSSSGSAVAVARGLVPFSLGTDTAGSGRVPAAMCGIVGLKPTVGRLPSLGMVPAVRRIDCPSVFARTVADARLVARIAEGRRAGDAYSREAREALRAVRTLGVLGPDAPARTLMQGDAQRAYDSAIEQAGACGFQLVAVDIDGLLDIGRLLYGGPFVAERTAAVWAAFAAGGGPDGDGVDPTVHAIVAGGASRTAVEAYNADYELAERREATRSVWAGIDALLLPTTPGVATLAEVQAEPLTRNAWLGTFTTFTNLLDLAAIAVPVGSRPDGGPAGVQLIGPAWSDEALADAAALLLGESSSSSSSESSSSESSSSESSELRTGEVGLVVVGAHLSGMALNPQLTGRGARLVRAARTAPVYRLFALAGTVPPKPGLRRLAAGGAAIDVELWALGPAAFASFVGEVPPPLAIGSVQLDDGSWCRGFVCEPIGFDDATDITEHGGWRSYVAAASAAASAAVHAESSPLSPLAGATS